MILDTTDSKKEITSDAYRNQDSSETKSCKKPFSEGKETFC